MNETLFPAATPADQAARLVLTNRSNIVDFVSSGLVRPKAAMDKYYADLAELVDGVTPVVAAPLSAELVDYVSRRPTQFPVAVEISGEAVSATTDPRIGAITVATLDSIVRVHLQSTEDLEELTARRFDNVDWSRLQFDVTPELFEGGTVTCAEIREALPEARGTALDFMLEDRIGGARLLALQAAPRSSGAFGAVASVVFGTRGRRRSRAEVPGWLEIDESLSSYAPRKSAGYDERVFLAAASACLGASRTDSWDGGALTDKITQSLHDDPNLKPADLARWDKAALRIHDIVSASRAFEGFGSPEFSTEGAVLLVALRGGAEDVLAWRSESIGAHDWMVTVAALLVGLVHGRTAIGVELRPAALDSALARLERDRLLGTPRTGTSEVIERGWDEVLLLDRKEIFTRARPPMSGPELFARLDLAGDTTRAGLLELARKMGWSDAIRTTVIIRGPFTHEATRGESRITFHGEPGIENDIDAGAVSRHVLDEDGQYVRDALERLSTRAGQSATT